MTKIPLTQGKVAMVDDADAPDLLRYNWAAMKAGENDLYYAGRKGRRGAGEKRTVLMHRQIMGAPDGLEIDHQDCDGLNNQRDNLRVATGTQNRRNRRVSKSAHSGYKGIWICDGRWGASITYDRKKIHLGLYRTAEMAAHAYDAAARQYYGEFARVNFPNELSVSVVRGTSTKAEATSRYRGVTYVAKRQRWVASITVKSKRCFIGRFKVERDAALAYDAKAKELLGEAAVLNFPQEERA